ncbi:50S ribosomal protein L19e [Candidatus Woesearchaeota archaeon]|nr:50S ribosomal protein L19e [Candidatus Woesearchaeota archaeon]
MRLTVQKRLASQLLKCSPDHVWVDPERLEEIKEAITKQDIRNMINNGLIVKKQIRGSSRVRARKNQEQKKRSRRRGKGSRKGTKNARTSPKRQWITRMRVQRTFLKELREKKLISPQDYRVLVRKSKGGFFRNKRHIKLFITEKGYIQKK